MTMISHLFKQLFGSTCLLTKEKLQKNLNIILQPPPPHFQTSPHFALPPFSSKNFQTPSISINSEKVEPLLYEGGGEEGGEVQTIQLELTFELESDLCNTVDWNRKWLIDFIAGKTQLVLLNSSNNTGAIDVKMNGSVLVEKSPLKMLGLTVSIAKTASKKIGTLNCSMKFLSPEVVLYLYKSIIQPLCNAVVISGLQLLAATWNYKLQKWIYRTVGPSLAEPLAHCQNVASLSVFYRCYFGRCSFELVELVPLPYFQGSSTHYSDGLHVFSVTMPRYYKDIYVKSLFPYTARLQNSMPI